MHDVPDAATHQNNATMASNNVIALKYMMFSDRCANASMMRLRIGLDLAKI
jgi:hypothetical protein